MGIVPNIHRGEAECRSYASASCHHAVQVQQHVGHHRPRGQLRGVCALRQRAERLGRQLLRRLRRPRGSAASSSSNSSTSVPHLLVRRRPLRGTSCRPKRGAVLGRRRRPPSAIRRASAWAASTKHRVVQRHERLQRRVRAAPGGSCRSRGWARRTSAIDGYGHRPPPEGVEPAAVAVLAVAGRLGALAVERRLPQAVRLRRIDRRAAHLAAQQPADRQRLVAHLSASSRGRGQRASSGCAGPSPALPGVTFDDCR